MVPKIHKPMKEISSFFPENGPNVLKNLTEEERAKRFGYPMSRPKEFIRSPNSLKEVLETEFFPLRKIDIKRMVSLGQSAGQGKINVLDLGCGKGTLCRLLSQEIEQESIEGMVIGADNNIDLLTRAKKDNADRKNLNFVGADTKRAEETFKGADMCIVSWTFPPEAGISAIDYNSIDKLKVPIILHIGDTLGIMTGHFKESKNYIKIGEWQGPASMNFTRHGLDEKEGLNLFEIFIRKDFAGNRQALGDRMEALDKDYQEGNLEEYAWEKELKEYFPEKDRIRLNEI